MPEDVPLTENSQESLASRLFGAAAILTGVLIGGSLFWTGAVKLSQWRRSHENIEVRAAVVETHIDCIRESNNKTGAQNTKYEVYVVLEFAVRGESVRSEERLASCWSMDEAMEVVRRCPIGKAIPVFCHPDNPKHLFLDSDLPLVVPSLMVLFGASTFLGCGYGAVVYARSMFGGKSPSADAESA